MKKKAFLVKSKHTIVMSIEKRIFRGFNSLVLKTSVSQNKIALL